MKRTDYVSPELHILDFEVSVRCLTGSNIQGNSTSETYDEFDYWQDKV